MNANEQFEIKAHVFWVMTGFLAPGKDAPMESGPSIEERGEAYVVWNAQYGEVIHHVLCAVEDHLANVTPLRLHTCVGAGVQYERRRLFDTLCILAQFLPQRIAAQRKLH